MKTLTETIRFSRQYVTGYLQEEIALYENNYRFNSDQGWAQVKGKGEELNRAYGAYDALLSVYSDLIKEKGRIK